MQQLHLPLAEAEASYQERWNDLVLALLRIGQQCDAEMSAFCRWVFNVTKGGTAGELVRSYRKLAERPLGLCCSPEKARSTVEQAERLGLVTVTRRRRFDGSQSDNAYTINWSGVRALKCHAARTVAGALVGSDACGFTTPRESGYPPKAPGLPDQGPGPGGQAPGLPDQGPGPGHHHTRNILSVSSCRENYRTGPEAAAGPGDFSETESHKPQHQPRSASAVSFAPQPAPRSDPLLEQCLRTVPELREARQVPLAPLPAGKLLYGVFAPITEDHLQKPLGFVHWTRQQASTPDPILECTEAGALLAMSAALYAAGLKKDQVHRNRVAAMVNVLSRRQWRRILPYVPEARRLLDAAIAEKGVGPLGRLVEIAP